MKIKLIENWQSSWKFASVQWSALGIVLMSIIESVNQISPEVIQSLPHGDRIAQVIFILTFIGRLIKFEGNSDEQK